ALGMVLVEEALAARDVLGAAFHLDAVEARPEPRAQLGAERQPRIALQVEADEGAADRVLPVREALRGADAVGAEAPGGSPCSGWDIGDDRHITLPCGRTRLARTRRETAR